MKKSDWTFNHLETAIRSYFSITPYMPIMEWIDKYINYSDDVSAERDKPDFSEFPYQVEPIKQWEDLNIRKQVTVVACEQMGKTNIFILGLLWRMVYDPCQSLCVYPSDSKAIEMAETKIRPLISHIPRIERRTAQTKISESRSIQLLQSEVILAGCWIEDRIEELQDRHC